MPGGGIRGDPHRAELIFKKKKQKRSILHLRGSVICAQTRGQGEHGVASQEGVLGVRHTMPVTVGAEAEMVR